MPEISTLLAGTGIAGIAIAFWDQVKLYGSKIVSIFIIRSEIFGHNTIFAMKVLINEEFKVSKLRKRTYRGTNEYIRSIKRNQLVCFERIPSEQTVFWRNKRPIVVSGGGEGIVVSFIRGMYDADKLIEEAMEKFNASKQAKDWRSKDNFFVKRLTGSIGSKTSAGSSKKDDKKSSTPDSSDSDSSSNLKFTGRPISWTKEDLGQPKSESALSYLSLDKSADLAIKESFIWRDSEKWFKDRKIPWKKGWLLYGKPGTGKTAFTRALAQELNMPIFSFDLATMNNVDFTEAWEKAMNQNPCIVLFEDFDAIFKGRENISITGMESGLTFDCFLNSLDGVQNTDGVFIIVTTNNIEVIDPALGNIELEGGISSRPGRIDRSLEFKTLNPAGRLKMAKRIFVDFPKEDWEIVLEEGNSDTGAQFQERCCRIAIDLFWKKENKNFSIESMTKKNEDDIGKAVDDEINCFDLMDEDYDKYIEDEYDWNHYDADGDSSREAPEGFE
jgi:hypothetical protein